jgi:hypothetical protein
MDVHRDPSALPQDGFCCFRIKSQLCAPEINPGLPLSNNFSNTNNQLRV